MLASRGGRASLESLPGSCLGPRRPRSRGGAGMGECFRSAGQARLTRSDGLLGDMSFLHVCMGQYLVRTQQQCIVLASQQHRLLLMHSARCRGKGKKQSLTADTADQREAFTISLLAGSCAHIGRVQGAYLCALLLSWTPFGHRLHQQPPPPCSNHAAPC